MAKILIVDDDPDVVDAVKLCLENEGHQTASAHSRDEGMRQVEAFQPDLLILDVMMDQADDGMAMAQDLRRQGFASPIFMLTNINQLTGMDYGKDDELVPVDAYLQKPVEPAKLTATVSELLARKEG